MTDTMTAEQRHRCMSRIRGKDTKPEMVVRRWLWSNGLRYRLHGRKLPGRPDIVIGRLKRVIFINGCFWHGHGATEIEGGELADSPCCRIPHTNREFWLEKITRNKRRDATNIAALEAAGWRVVTVWECELKRAIREQTLSRLLALLQPPCPAAYSFDDGQAGDIAAEATATYGRTV